jgi:hypothetical protein
VVLLETLNIFEPRPRTSTIFSLLVFIRRFVASFIELNVVFIGVFLVEWTCKARNWLGPVTLLITYITYQLVLKQTEYLQPPRCYKNVPDGLDNSE